MPGRMSFAGKKVELKVTDGGACSQGNKIEGELESGFWIRF
jgi:hypothetical protein